MKTKAFTLIELLIVIAITGILYCVVTASISSHNKEKPTDFWEQQKQMAKDAKLQLANYNAREVENQAARTKMEKFCGEGNVTSDFSIMTPPKSEFFGWRCRDYSQVPNENL